MRRDRSFGRAYRMARQVRAAGATGYVYGREVNGTWEYLGVSSKRQPHWPPVTLFAVIR